jgi:hypothetical protein
MMKWRRLQLCEHVAKIVRQCTHNLVGKFLGIGPRKSWHDNIKMDLRETGCEKGGGAQNRGGFQISAI